jgi:hypothetical protein
MIYPARVERFSCNSAERRLGRCGTKASRSMHILQLCRARVPVNQHRLSCGSYVSSGTPIPARVRNEMVAKMQKHGAAHCYQYSNLTSHKLGACTWPFQPNLFEMGRTWAPSPLSFPACDNVDSFEEGGIIDVAMPIRIPIRKPLAGPMPPLSAVH